MERRAAVCGDQGCRQVQASPETVYGDGSISRVTEVVVCSRCEIDDVKRDAKEEQQKSSSNRRGNSTRCDVETGKR